MWMISFLLLFLLLFYIPTVHGGFCCAAVLNQSQDVFLRMENRHSENQETINTRRMCLGMRMLVSFHSSKNDLVFFTSFVEPPCVVLE